MIFFTRFIFVHVIFFPRDSFIFECDFFLTHDSLPFERHFKNVVRLYIFT